MKAKYKLRVYKVIGAYDHEEYFDTKEEMDIRYEILSYRMGEPLPTAWKLVDGEWKRLEGY